LEIEQPPLIKISTLKITVIYIVIQSK